MLTYFFNVQYQLCKYNSWYCFPFISPFTSISLGFLCTIIQVHQALCVIFGLQSYHVCSAKFSQWLCVLKEHSTRTHIFIDLKCGCFIELFYLSIEYTYHFCPCIQYTITLKNYCFDSICKCRKGRTHQRGVVHNRPITRFVCNVILHFCGKCGAFITKCTVVMLCHCTNLITTGNSFLSCIAL